MPTSQQPATNRQKPRGDATNPDQLSKSATRKGGRRRKAVRAGGISVEQFLKLFH